MKNSLKSTSAINLLFIITFLANSTFAAAGDFDKSFNTSAFGRSTGAIQEIVEQPDGKILVGGFFTEANGRASGGIARYNLDGTVDTGFNPPIFFSGFGVGSLVRAIALQSDGKILVAGDIQGYNQTFSQTIQRLNSDGSPDISFDPVISGANYYDVEVLPDGKILAAGLQGLYKYDVDGTFIAAASGIGVPTDIEILPNGKIYISSNSSGALRRLNSDLTVDSTFTAVDAGNAVIDKIEILPNGQIIAVGPYATLNGFPIGKVARINTDGSLDLSFNLNNVGANGTIADVDVKSDGKIVASGYFSKFNGIDRNRLAQLNTDGTLVLTFQTTNAFDIPALAVLVNSNSDVFVGLNSNPNFVDITNSFLKINADGSLNTSFDAKITRNGRVEKIQQQSNGKIYIAGEFQFVNGFQTRSIARLNADGTVDTSFVSGFSQANLPRITSFVVQPDGKIIVGADSFGRGLYRLNTDGSFDVSVTNNTFAYDLALLDDGKFLVAEFNKIVRRNADFTIDNSFTQLIANNQLDTIKLLPDGKILVGGAFTSYGGNTRGRIARLNADGTFDNSFNPPGGANGTVLDIELQSDGKILLGGFFTGLNGSSTRNKIGRLNSDGTLDTTFAQIADAPISVIKVQSDGKILVGGVMSSVGGVSKVGMARLNADGSLDNSFTANAPQGVLGIEIQVDNKILIGGQFITVNGRSSVRVARLLGDNAVNQTIKFDYDGDGRADISVFRPSNNVWYQLLGVNYNFTSSNFGLSGDIVTPGDYDGDGKSDLAIFRPSTGDWWYQSSLNGSQIPTHFGQSGDVPRSADFDGDGIDDRIVYRPSNNVWYRLGSTGTTSIIQFGIAEDKPVVGDFDGDGKGDIAIYRPSTGTWWYQSSLDGQNKATQFGISTDIPNPADFDGDGKTDLAVFRPATGVWYIFNSSNNSATIIQFGTSGDKPIAADYDGDGKADIAVYRPSTGVWYLLKTTEGFEVLQFGISTDIPIPNAFVP